MKFRFHVLGLPHTRTTEEYLACAYTQKVLKFCKMMTQRGHHVIHYGTAGSDPICSENVEILSEDTFQKVYGDHDFRSKWFKFSTNDDAYKEFYRRGIEEVGKRKKKNDFILPFWGSGTRPICDAHQDECIVVEPGIGYSGGHWAKWKIFESHALLHAYKGLGAVSSCNMSWYETVIPNYFDLKDFECGPEERDDYMLFVGRVYNGKGLNIAIQVTERLGLKLKVAGQLAGPYEKPDYKWPDHVEYVGSVGVEERKKLMMNAMGSYVASMYIEPFGGVQVENLLCGTPTITTDWGAFSMNNIEGVTGYRCRTFGDFVKATKKVINKEISYADCRKKGEEFSLEAIAPKYEKYFTDVMNVHIGEGWYTVEEDLEEDQPPCYIVLGMHRSSTSMLAKALHTSEGVHMGTRLVPDDHYENWDFVRVNADMFKELGTDWKNPPTYKQLEEIAPKYEKRMKKAIKEAIKDAKDNGYRSWGFKDPRTCITLPFWLKFIKDPRIVAMKRSNEEVALSLNKRNDIPMEKGRELAKRYNDAIRDYDIWSKTNNV